MPLAGASLCDFLLGSWSSCRKEKLIFPNSLGAGRFARIGIPFPDVMGLSWVSSRPSAAHSYRWAVHAPRSDSVDHYHDRGSYLDQAADLARARCLDISSRSGHQAHRLLEHDARSARRSQNAARLYLSPDCRGRALVIGCAHSTQDPITGLRGSVGRASPSSA